MRPLDVLPRNPHTHGMTRTPNDTQWPPLGVRDLKVDTKHTPGGRLDAMREALRKAGLVK